MALVLITRQMQARSVPSCFCGSDEEPGTCFCWVWPLWEAGASPPVGDVGVQRWIPPFSATGLRRPTPQPLHTTWWIKPFSPCCWVLNWCIAPWALIYSRDLYFPVTYTAEEHNCVSYLLSWRGRITLATDCRRWNPWHVLCIMGLRSLENQGSGNPST